VAAYCPDGELIRGVTILLEIGDAVMIAVIVITHWIDYRAIVRPEHWREKHLFTRDRCWYVELYEIIRWDARIVLEDEPWQALIAR